MRDVINEYTLTTEDVAEILGIEKQTIALWRSRKKHLRYVKIGACARYRPADIKAWLESQVVEVKP